MDTQTRESLQDYNMQVVIYKVNSIITQVLALSMVSSILL